VTLWDTLARPWQVCLEEAWAALCAGSLPIGSCVTDADSNVLSRGRNRLFENDGPHGQIFGHDLAHAEMNALLGLRDDPGPVERHARIVYTTTEPCPLCLGAFYMSGARTLRFAARDPYAGSTNLIGATPYLSRKPVTVTGPESADIETLLVALHVAVSLRRGHNGARHLLDAWRPLLSDGVTLGEALAASGLLDTLRAENMDTADVIHHLCEVRDRPLNPPR